MATRFTFRCTNCNYSVQMSGQPDALMKGPTIPCVCKKCKTISDRLICYFPKGTETVEPDPKCDECGSKSYELWNYEKKVCPNCEIGTMEIDPEGLEILAD